MSDSLQKGLDLLQKEIKKHKIALRLAENKNAAQEIADIYAKIEAKQAVVDYILGVAFDGN